MSGNSRRGFSALLILALLATSLGGFNSEAKAASPTLISEFQPNPPGTDPNTMFFELSGTPSDAYDVWILSIESDSGTSVGIVDRATNVTGSFDTNGLATVSIPDLENPSFTVLLADTFTGAVGTTDIDVDNNGTADDVSSIGTILDAIGIPDNVTDETFLYGVDLGGTDFSYIGDEPKLVFRDASTGSFYAIDDNDAPDDVYDINANLLNVGDFDSDPTLTTFGVINPSYTPSDIPPIVSSTTPANLATDVAIDADIAISFSEDVTVTGSWFTINCASSGAHTATVTGGPQNYTLNPGADFSNSEVCTVTVVAAQVADQDGTADNMAYNHVFSFTTINSSPPASVIINEFLADPAADLPGDANGDGTRDSSQDEFVEIVNISGADLDVSGWTISDGFGVRHTFPNNTIIPANCNVVVFGGGTPTGTFGNSLVQTASTGALGLNNTGDTITVSDGSTDQASISYGSEGGDNQSLTLDPDITGSSYVKHSVATGAGGTLFSPGMKIDGTNFSGCSTSTGCGTPATLISTVQGTGLISPLIGNTVTIEAIVTADFQESDELSGFFLQEEVSDDDLNPLTSEGIFVHSTSTDVAVGDLVHLTGTAGEYYEMTQINSVTDLEICSNNNTLPMVTSLLLPLGNAAALEIVEGMYVQYSLPLYVTETYNLGRYGEVWLSSISPLDTPTNVVEPGTDANLMEIANDLNRVLLDDFSQIQNPPTVPYLRPSNDTLRIGDTVTNLTGVINYSYSCYRLQPTTPVTFTPANARPGVPSVGGTLNVASFNVLNYFTTLGSRGANTMEEFTRQRDKIIEAIIALDADVIGLMEIENNGYGTNSAIHNLVSGLNDSAGSSVYAFIDPGVTAIGSDEIAVGLIYKVDSVESVGLASILDSSVDPNFNSNKNRPVLAQTFRDLSNNGQFTVAVNHLKSKGSNCNNIGDPDTGDGQGNCNLTRTSAAAALVDWLATDPTGTSETDFLIIGDLNAYLQEDPINAIEVGADDIESTTDDYVDLVTQFAGNSIPYSYVYDGERGVLDHALASSPMQSQVTGVAHWHINADEPRILDYNTEYGQEALNLYVVDPFRSSDHDPVVIGLNLMPQTFVDLPLLMTKVFDVLQGEQVSFDPLLDLNPNGLAWVEESIRIVSGPLHGGAWVASIHYVPYASYLGDDTLTYQICDTSNQCWRVVVNYNVTAKALPDTGFAPGVKTEFDGVSNLQPLSANGISLSIPSLSVNAEVVGVPLSGDSWDVRWLSGQVGYLAGTAYPTWNGNTLLTAHIYDANGLPGPFHQLKSLKWGDVVQIDAYGLTYTYQVRQVYHWVSPTDAHAFQHEEMDWITLVTCQGYDSASNSYPWRTVVRAVLVSVE